MKFVYPYELEREEGSIVVHFPDVPGATTQVDKGEDFIDRLESALRYFGLQAELSVAAKPLVAQDVVRAQS